MGWSSKYYCWWVRNPKQPPGMVLKPVVNNGICFPYQLVIRISEPSTVVGGFNPVWKILYTVVKFEIFPQIGVKINTYLKPPSSYGMYMDQKGKLTKPNTLFFLHCRHDMRFLQILQHLQPSVRAMFPTRWKRWVYKPGRQSGIGTKSGWKKAFWKNNTHVPLHWWWFAMVEKEEIITYSK